MKEKTVFLVMLNVSLMLGSYIDRNIEQEFENFLINDHSKTSEVYHPYKIWRSLFSWRPRNPWNQEKSLRINSVGWSLLNFTHKM